MANEKEKVETKHTKQNTNSSSFSVPKDCDKMQATTVRYWGALIRFLVLGTRYYPPSVEIMTSNWDRALDQL